MKRIMLALAVLLLSRPVFAELKTRTIDYKEGETQLSGYLAYDTSFHGKRPGVLVFHEWWGMGPYVKRRADMLAKLGYVAFAADMYGKGVYTRDHEEAAKLMNAVESEPGELRRRALAGLDVLKAQPNVDDGDLAAIGYCFGGAGALELARAGVPLKGVVTFHGMLSAPQPEAHEHITAKILVCQGGADTWTLGALPAFEKEMRDAGADVKVIIYPHAVHGFTVKEAGNDPSTGMAYNAAADKKSWSAMKKFLAQVLQ